MPKSYAYGKLRCNAIKLEGVKLSHHVRLFVSVEQCEPDCALIFLELRNIETDESLKLQFDDCVNFEKFPKGYISTADYLIFLTFWQTPPPAEEHIGFLWRALSSIIARKSVLTISSSPVAHTADDALIVFLLDVGQFETEVKVDPDKLRGIIEVINEEFEEKIEETKRFEDYAVKVEEIEGK